MKDGWEGMKKGNDGGRKRWREVLKKWEVDLEQFPSPFKGQRQSSLIVDAFQGLETSTPYMQLGGRMYEGQYEYVMGTHMYFQEKKGAEGELTSRYYGLSTKKLIFRPVIVVPKDVEQAVEGGGGKVAEAAGGGGGGGAKGGGGGQAVK
jgi:hypothetical protein